MKSNKQKRFPPLDRTRDQELSTMESEGVVYRRTLNRVGSHKIIILHKDERRSVEPFRPVTAFHHLAVGDASQGMNAGVPFEIPGDPWSEAGASGNHRFNCLTYALGDRVGLTPDDWIEGIREVITDWTNPMETLLALYFKQIKVMDVSLREMLALTDSQFLQDDDIYSMEGRLKTYGRVVYHAGRICKLSGENYLVSKIGEARLVITPLHVPLSVYPRIYGIPKDQFIGPTKVKFYRFIK
jgi:hypothetical protein